ncbi:hypothetical protein DTL42_25760 [Bremerella cremea]|uniref:Uncharacterized protein n=2 Tax=Bremerella cremea TaxID=1031537 RepID=A0A368KJL9_9BACT|nr:hypothetical protein DTL42_25760 [Bremerella cremea]
MHLGLRWRWIPLGKRFITFILLGCMLAWGGGISIPVPSFKDTSTPFMCQDHACSCRNARNCWTHCCCFSRAEKLAWAAKQKIEPPEYAQKATPPQHDHSSEFCGMPPNPAPKHDTTCHHHHAAQPVSKPKPMLAADCRGPAAAKSQATSSANDTQTSIPISLTNDMRCHALASVTLIYSPVLELDLGQGQLVRLTSEPLPTFSSLRPNSFRAAPDPPPPRA